MASTADGPASSLFRPVPIRGNCRPANLSRHGVSDEMAGACGDAPVGEGVCWGIPFTVGSLLVASRGPVSRRLEPVRGRWFVFLHTTDTVPLEPNADGFFTPMRGTGRLAEPVADYVIEYADGGTERIPVRRRHEVGMFRRHWGENCVACVAHRKPHAIRPPHEQLRGGWGNAQTRVTAADSGPWVNWLFAWENPRPDVPVTRLRIEPRNGVLILSGLSVGDVSGNPLRTERREKAVVVLPEGESFDPRLDGAGTLSQIRIDLGQVISAVPRPVYPAREWEETANNLVPELSAREVLVEYTAHPEARFHFADGTSVPCSGPGGPGKTGIRSVPPAHVRVRLRVVESGSRAPVPVKLHVHGSEGEYLAPTDRHRIPNPAWFEDYAPEFSHLGIHPCTYINGETTLDVPRGDVFVEVSKGFEVRPIRRRFRITAATRELEIEVERVLPWRDRGWVSADTHVHFLSPPTALLEGSGEGVNVVNLLASQWGELMTNAGDFDGRTTFGSRESGGDGEFLVRVGTENRQHVLGHISLLGYEGSVISPMTTGGPDESALGDPVEILLTEWARQCREQNGVVVLPHFPNPRLEGAAAIVSGLVDGVEMTSWGDLYSGISPYSLSDWYRYLNCGVFVAAVGGTDKMSANTAVGTVRTYARLRDDEPFTYDNWKDAVRRGATFVTYGPLLEFAADGHAPGSRVALTRTGGTMDITWEVASVTIPVTRVELVVNGEIRESATVDGAGGAGSWRTRIESSSWVALLVRGRYPGKPEVIAAHSSPVLFEVAGTGFSAAADALTILEQIEGALAYLDTLATRADTAAMKRMRMVLTTAHRDFHNRMHRQGRFHVHTPAKDHPEHR